MTDTYDPLSALPSLARLMCAAMTGVVLSIGLTSVAAGQFGDLVWLALLPIVEASREALWSS